MANTGNTQQQIDYGAAANDGQGDPLRVAFIKTDDNFDAIWNAGPVGSNITIVNNILQSNNTNGNIVLRPNGVGVIQANAAIVPNATNLRDLGAAEQRFRAAYIGTGGLSVDGNVTVTGNLTAGNISYTGNVFVGDLQGSVYADDSTIMVDAIDNEMFATAVTFGRANVSGNVSANYFIGNGSLLTGVASSYGNTEVAAYLASNFGAPGSNTVVTVGNVVARALDVANISHEFPIGIQTNGGGVWQFAGNILRGPQGGSWTSAADTSYFNSPANGFLNLSSLVNGNVVSELFMEHSFIRFLVDNGGPEKTWQMNLSGEFSVPGDIIPQSNGTASLGNSTNYWSNLWVANNTIYIGGVPLGITGNTLTVNGEPVGNVDADLPTYGGNILVDYLIGNTTDNSGYLQWQGNSSGDNNGYTTLRLVPDDTLVSNDQYLIVDPTAPNHIHIRAGGTQDASQAELYLGGEANYVRVADGTGVRLQNQTRNDTFYTYSDPTDFNTGTWYESGGTFFVQYTTADAELINVSFQFNNDNENTLRVYYNAGANNAVLTSAGSVSNLGGGVYRVSVNEAPPANPTAISEFEYEIWSTRTNSVTLSSNDFTVDVTDDLRITGNDIVSLRNRSTTDPITIRTDYDGADRVWEFAADGTLSTPGDIVVNGDVTGTAGGSTLVIRAEPGSNTAIQLNDIVDSEIRTVANLEIRTDVSNTAQVWSFATDGSLTAPGAISATGNITGGNLSTTGNVSATRLQNDANLEIRSNVAGTARTWTFDTLGDLNLPVGGNISGSGGISANNITLTGNISANTAGFAIGYRDIPQVAFTGNATMAAADAGKHFYSTESTDYVLTIADNSAVSWPVGTAITVVNRGTGNITVAQASGVSLYLAGNSSAGNRTVSTYGMATVLNVAANVWMINGTGVA